MTLMTLSNQHPSFLRLHLLGYMIFPEDKDAQARSDLALTAISKAAGRQGLPVTLSPQDIGRLADTPGFHGFGAQIERATRQGGAAAGDTLLTVVRLKASCTAPSLAKAQFHLMKATTRKTLATGDRALRSAWSHYKRVAHLWAAWQLGLSRDAQARGIPYLADDPLKFLSLAMAVYRMAENVGPAGQAILGPDTWLPPFDVPDCRAVTLSPLTDRELRRLSKYKRRARESSFPS